jgi:hypothetical protein
LRSLWLFVDGLVLRWVSPLFTALTGIFAFFATYDFSALVLRYPDWPGLFELLSSGFFDLGFFISAPIAFAASLFVAKRQSTVKELIEDRDKYKEQTQRIGETVLVLFDGVLLNLSRKLKLDADPSVRLSIYIHNESHSCFVPCGRFSSNPVLRKKGRTRFPDNEGCIAKAWQNGWHFDAKFPTAGESRNRYNFKEYSIPILTSSRLKMIPHLIAAQRVQDFSHRPVAVIVVESTRQDAFSEESVLAVLKEESVSMGKMMDDLRQHIPTPQEAESRGL